MRKLFIQNSVITLVLSPFLIGGAAIGLALAYTHWGSMNLRLIGGLALIIAGLGVTIYKARSIDRLAWFLYFAMVSPAIVGMGILIITGNPLYLVGGFALMIGIQIWVKYFQYPQSLRESIQFLQQGKNAEALQAVNNAIKDQPNNERLYILRSMIRMGKFQLAESESDARVAVRIKSKNSNTHFLLSQTLIAQGRYDEAKEPAIKAAAID
jgi:tetratricopeptide (TPR) repeat protein